MTEESLDNDLETILKSSSTHTTSKTQQQQSHIPRQHDDDVVDVDEYFYELLGAPMLLYRNREMYTKQDEDSTFWNYQKQGGNGRSVKAKYVNANVSDEYTNKNNSHEQRGAPSQLSSSIHAVSTNAAALFCHHQSLLYRAQARWYYPMDYHLIPKHHHPSLPHGIKTLYRKWSKQQQMESQKLRWNVASEVNISAATLDVDGNDSTAGSVDDADLDDDNDFLTAQQPIDSLLETQPNGNAPPLPGQPTAVDLIPNHTEHDTEYMQVMEELQNALNRHHDIQQRPGILCENGNETTGTGTNADTDKNAGANEMIPPNDDNTAKRAAGPSKNNTAKVHPTQLPPIKDRHMAAKQMFQSNEYNITQMFQLQLQARAHMLLGNSIQQRTRNYHIRQILQAYTQLDTNYIPGQEKIKFNYTYDRTNPVKAGDVVRTNHKRTLGITRQLQQQTQMYDRERWNRSTPEYMAPFHLPSVRYAVAHDLQSRQLLPTTKTVPTTKRVVPPISHDDPNRPTLFGNCLLSFPCQCDVCCSITTRSDTSQNETHENVPVPCLLHPTGPLQDRIRLSFLQLPLLHRSIGGHCEPRRNIPEELDVGDRVRQMELCGHDPYVVIIRTDLHCTVATIAFVCPRRTIPQQPNECWGTANLQQIHRIDFRTMWRSLPSFHPINMTCHPNYGVRSCTPGKVAVVYTASGTNVRNTIHHYQITNDTYSVQKLNIINLQDITEIVFANHHPMLLYCIGRSYVRPTLTTSYIQKNRPRIGHGYALYRIDLRQQPPQQCTGSKSDSSITTCSAVYVWSPNIQEYTSEGIYSISGLQSDWNSQHIHYLWVSSISAGKTYLIDTRMPCQCIHSFSLPYLCDQPGAHLPPTGLYGAGTLFSRPYHLRSSYGSNGSSSSSSSDTTTGYVMMTVAKTPGAFGIHMYQIPSNRSRFQTQSVECMIGPNLSHLGNKLSLAKSMIIPLSDVSENIFTCGLTTFCIPFDVVCHQSYISKLGIPEHNVHGMFCTISLTNRGDIYAHMLLQTNAEKAYSTAFDDLPMGYSAIPVPPTTKNCSTQWNVIPIDLTNHFPIPGHTIRSTGMHSNSKSTSSILDLSLFIENEEKAKLRQGKKRKQNRGPDRVTSAILEKEEVTATVLPLDDVHHRVVVATCDDAIGPLPLRLPSHLLPRPLSTEIQTEHFLPINRSDIERTLNQIDVSRSDLTPEILGDAWSERDL